MFTPLIAREFETGTFRLVWTQGITRTRWLAVKLGIVGLAAVAAGELFSLMLNWWAGPIHKASPDYIPFTSSSYISGVAPTGYAAFAFAPSVAAGLFIRRTLPAMAVALAVFAAVMTVFPSGCGPTSCRSSGPPQRSAWHRSPESREPATATCS
jgi:hypothetical protein